MVDDIFDVFFDSVCEYFVEYFLINDHKENWSGTSAWCGLGGGAAAGPTGHLRGAGAPWACILPGPEG